MRIAVSGCPRQNKDEYIKAFVKKWPNYKVLDPDFKTWAEQNNINLGDKMTEKDADEIFGYYTDILSKLTSDDNVIIAGSPMDLVVRTVYNHEMGLQKYSDAHINKIIFGCKHLYVLLDVIFWFPLTRAALNTDVTPEDNALDSFYKALNVSYQNHTDSFFPVQDTAALVEIYGKTEDARIGMTQYYLNEKGEVIPEDESMLKDTLESLQEPAIIAPDSVTDEKIKKAVKAYS